MARRRAKAEAAARTAAGDVSGSADGSGGTATELTATSGDPTAATAPQTETASVAAAPAFSGGSGGSDGSGGPSRSAAPPPLPPLGALFDDLLADCLAEPVASRAAEFWDTLGAFSLAPPPPPPAPAPPPPPAWPLQRSPAALALPEALEGLPWLVPARLELKLHGPGAAPWDLPPGLAAAAASTLFASPPAGLTAAAAPGCTLLTFEAAVLRSAAGRAATSAEGALRRLLQHGVQGAHLRRLDAVSLATADGVARAVRGTVVAMDAAATPAAAPRLPPLAALAALRHAPAQLSAAEPLPPARALRCRWHGRFLRVDDDGQQAQPGRLRLAVPDDAHDGVALLERQLPAADAGAAAGVGAMTQRGAPRPVLLCSDAAVVAELNAAAAATAGDAALRDAAEEAVIVIGHALRPRACAEAAAAAVAACTRQRWSAAAARCAAAMPPASALAPAAAAALLAAFAGSNPAATAAGADLAVAWARASPSRAVGESDGAAAAALRLQLAAAAPLARAAAAAAAEAYGIALPPHVAELAGCELDRIAAAASCDSRVVAALAAATLRAEGCAWSRAQCEAECPALAEAKPAPAGGDVAAVVAAPPLSEAAWRFRQYIFGVEFFALYFLAYHAAQVVRGVNHPPLPLLPRTVGELALDRTEICTIMDALRHRSLWAQAPTTAALVLPLIAGARGRAFLARHLQPLLAAQFAVHALCTTSYHSRLAFIEVLLPRGVDAVMLPLQFAAGIAVFTLLCAACWPLRPAWALPLLAARAAMPALQAAGLLPPPLAWPPTGAGGAALQAAACFAAATHVLLRERRLREAYRLYAAAARRLKAE